jgi:hypothetical protein
MPISKCSNGKYRIGTGSCIYDTQVQAAKVWAGIIASGKYKKTYNDYPESASNNAKKALKWAEENGWGECGTAVGKARANR